MKFLKSRYGIALLCGAFAALAWQAFRVQRAKEAGNMLGMVNYNYAADSTDRYNAENWDGYETGSGVPPWSK
jgi:hypothetical protein